MRWEIAQLGKLCEEQPKIVEEALAALQTHQPEVWRRIVIGGYLDQQINLSKAAELIAHQARTATAIRAAGHPSIRSF